MKNKSMKIGLFGGTFDPPTIAHLIAAQYALDVLELDRIDFLPTSSNPLKSERLPQAPEIRLQLLEAAIEDNPDFAIETHELFQQDPSYTVETLRYLKSKYPENEYIFIAGSDILVKLHQWREVESIFDLAKIIIITRPGYNPEDQAKTWIKRVEILRIPGLDLSSTYVRTRLNSGESIKYIVPEKVEKIIKLRNLYI